MRGEPVFVIAEAGVNHNGDLGMAKELVDVAVEAGADAVKFQSFRADNIILRNAPKAQYHIETTGADGHQSWYALLMTQELDRTMHEKLIAHCRDRGIMFLSTPYDEESVDLLQDLDIPLYKVASTDANNLPFLEYIARKGRPMILSTAMSELEEVRCSVDAIRKAGVDELVVLQCTGSYPAPPDQANLKAMLTLGEACSVAVGYSDHVSGFNAAIAAVALGACVYEKHFTLDRTLPGPDHRISLEPNELKALVAVIRKTESMLGDGIKRVMPCEEENRLKLRKYITARAHIAAGEKFSPENLTTKRTGGVGFEPKHFTHLMHYKAAKPIQADQVITDDLIERRSK
ncbi:N-acetylneuraminate synthase [Nitrospiraceae bacterium AH_259_D15_M11_P09]|nr:N-acetylneuraminate synthase [Nitrospiraceae bacterium AH_259_D15_M11_P09]